MSERSAAQHLPDQGGLPSLREAAEGCTGCDLYKNATQTVFGEGTRSAEIMLVGEQPGDKEDRSGKPFVGPAGRLLDQALEHAGIDRRKIYVTNIVKHFKWQPKGKRRIHKKPNADEIMACRPWFDAEVDRVEPKVIVALGATAAKALLGSSFRLTKHRGEFIDGPNGSQVTATLHPSSLLRIDDDDERREERGHFFAEMQAIATKL